MKAGPSLPPIIGGGIFDGTDFLQKLRQDPKAKSIPVVALTNLAEEAEKQKAMDLGVKEYLVKAMQTPEQVVEKIKKYLKAG